MCPAINELTEQALLETLQLTQEAQCLFSAHQPLMGALVGERFLLREKLGQGGFGSVYRATDQFTREDVAVKMLQVVDGRSLQQVQREIATLRSLHLDCVVGIFEDGSFEAPGAELPLHYIAMELVSGSPFPDLSPSVEPCITPWGDVKASFVCLMHALREIHKIGVVHRDLKPENIILRSSGGLVLIDFGLALNSCLNTSRGEGLCGTPEFLAPEQIGGKQVGPWSDLYAVGVMLYRVLSGRRLFPELEGLYPLLMAKASRVPTPLASLSPQAPAPLCAMVDRLLSHDIQERPTWREFMSVMLKRQLHSHGGVSSGQVLPWVGRDEPGRIALAWVRQGRSFDISAPRGGGRTRFLRTLGLRCAQAGLSVAYVRARTVSPVQSLATLLRGGEQDLVEIERAAHRYLARGGVLLVDDAEELDPQTASLLDKLQAVGCVVRTWRGPREGALWLSPLTQLEIKELFVASGRLTSPYHRIWVELWLRTAGHLHLVERQLQMWRREGVIRLAEEGQGFEVIPGTLGAMLQQALHVETLSRFHPRFQGLHEASLKLLVICAWCWPHASLELVQKAFVLVCGEASAAAFDQAWQTLEQRGLRLRVEEDTWLVWCAPVVHEVFSQEESRQIRRAYLQHTPPGTRGRLLHIQAVGSFRDLLEDTQAVLEKARFLEEPTELAFANLQYLLERGGQVQLPSEVYEPLLKNWFLLSYALQEALFLDQFLLGVERFSLQSVFVTQLKALASVAQRMRVATHRRSLQELEQVKAFEDIELEALRLSMYEYITRYQVETCQIDPIVALETLVPWDETNSVLSRLLNLRGRRAYERGRFQSAAEAYREALRVSRGDPVFALQVNHLRALLESFALQEVLSGAGRLEDLALQHYQTLAHARALYYQRAARYRLGVPQEADDALITAVVPLGLMQESLLHSVETVIAWRNQDMRRVRSLASYTRLLWERQNIASVASLYAALGWLCGVTCHGDDVEWIFTQAQKNPAPRLAAQTLGLMAMGGQAPPWDWRPVVDDARSALPEEHLTTRLEVLSFQEALEALEAL